MLNLEGSTERLEKWGRVAAFAFPLDILPFLFGRSPSFFCSVILVFFWIEHRSRFAGAFRLPIYFGVTLALWFSWCLVTLFWSAAPDVTIVALVSLVVQGLVFLALMDLLPRIRDQLVWWYAAGATCLAVWALVSAVETDPDGRVQVAGIDQNVTGLVLTVGFAAAVYLLVFTTDSFKRWPLVLSVVLLVASSVKVGSRTGVGGIGLVLVVALLISVWRLVTGGSTRFLRAGLLISAGVGAYLVMRRLGLVPDRILEFLTSPSRADDSERGQIISAYWELLDHWWLKGIGYGADAYYLEEHSTEGFRNAHSLFWKTWIETGMVGLVLWGAFLLGVLAIVIKNVRVDALGAVMSVPVIAFAYTLGGDRVAAFWFIVAVCLTPMAMHAPKVSGDRVSTKRARALRRARQSPPRRAVGRHGSPPQGRR